jgi:hypothetical protein
MTDQVHGFDAERWGGWSWDEPRHGEHFHTCSYCGSISPDDLVAESSWRAEWADMKYGWPHKFYVHILNRNPDRLFVIGSANGGAAIEYNPGPRYIRWDDLTAEQLEVCRLEGYPMRDGYKPQWIMLGTRTDHFGKFYTTHLQDPELTDDVRETIQRISGLRPTFADGRVRWEHYEEDSHGTDN